MAPSAHTTSQSQSEYAARTAREQNGRTLRAVAAAPGPDVEVEPHRLPEVRPGEPHKVVPRARREDVDDGGADRGVAVRLEAEDHLADFGVRGGHPHRAGAVEVLEDLQGAEEDLGRALAAAATTAAAAVAGGAAGGEGRAGPAVGGAGGAQALEGEAEDVAHRRGGRDVRVRAENIDARAEEDAGLLAYAGLGVLNKARARRTRTGDVRGYRTAGR